jgi:hypothetical protein
MANLICLKEAEYYISRFSKDFDFGEIVQERRLDPNRVADFNLLFERLLPHLVELRSITKGSSKVLADDIFMQVGKTKQDVVKLTKEASLKNEDFHALTIKLEQLVTLMKKCKKTDDLKYIHYGFDANLELFRSFEAKWTMLVPLTIALERCQKQLPEEWETTILLPILEELQAITSEVDGQKVKNRHLQWAIEKLHKKLDDSVFVISDALELEDFVDPTKSEPLPDDVISFVASKIRPNREINVFQSEIRDGKSLVLFKQNVHSKEPVIAYGTDPDINICREAKKNGVDVVAKKGIYHMSHQCFDISLCFIDQFSFYTPTGATILKTPEDVRFEFIFQRCIPRSNGLIIFNVPYYKLANFSRRIKRDLTIEGMYRVNDKMKNVLFICRYKQNPAGDEMVLRKAMLQYDKLPMYTEMEEIYINKGEVTHPKTFRPFFVDDEDIMQAFEGFPTSLSIAEAHYKPSEKIVELNSPLQTYKEGHLPAVATIEIVNGIYDSADMERIIGKRIDCPNIYSTKIVQQDVTEEIEELYKGEMVRIISQKKKNVIVSKVLYPNGDIDELLNTK